MDIATLFGRKPSTQTVSVLAEFAINPDGWLYGYELLKRTNLKTGSLYTILNRLNERGLLVSEWRGVGIDGETSRPYRVYKLTSQGREVATQELAHSFREKSVKAQNQRKKVLPKTKVAYGEQREEEKDYVV